MEGVYSKKLKRSTIKISIWIIISILAALAIGGYYVYRSYFESKLFPVITTEANMIAEGKGITVKTNQFTYMGFTDQVDGKDEAFYYALGVGDKVLIARNRQDLRDIDRATTTKEFSGVVKKNIYRDEDISRLVDMGMSKENAEAALLPYYLTDEDQEIDWWFLLLLIFPVLIFAGQIGNLKNNRKSKKQLTALYGGDLARAEQYFDAEFAQSDLVTKIHNFYITKNWVLSTNAAHTFLLPLKEVVWAYKTVVSRRTNGIPTGKTYKVNLYFSNGSTAVFTLAQKNVDALLGELQNRTGKIVIGYSDELMTAWRKDREGFVRQVRETLGE